MIGNRKQAEKIEALEKRVTELEGARTRHIMLITEAARIIALLAEQNVKTDKRFNKVSDSLLLLGMETTL